MNLHLDSFLLAAGFTNLDDVKKVISKINLTNVHFSLSLSLPLFVLTKVQRMS